MKVSKKDCCNYNFNGQCDEVSELYQCYKVLSWWPTRTCDVTNNFVPCNSNQSLYTDFETCCKRFEGCCDNTDPKKTQM